jgi:hypothetical protein
VRLLWVNTNELEIAYDPVYEFRLPFPMLHGIRQGELDEFTAKGTKAGRAREHQKVLIMLTQCNRWFRPCPYAYQFDPFVVGDQLGSTGGAKLEEDSLSLVLITRDFVEGLCYCRGVS